MRELQRFRQLREKYEQLEGRGAAFQLMKDLDLSFGEFQEKIRKEELAKLNREMERRMKN